MAFDHRDLLVYRRSCALADEVRLHVLRWPRFDRFSAGVQAVRAADSIGTNIAEGVGRYTQPDQRQFLVVARGSALELAHHLDVAEGRLLHVPAGGGDRAREIARMLNGLIRRRRTKPYDL